MLTKNDILACAYESGIPEGQVTDDIIELLQKRISLSLSHRPHLVKSALIDAAKCPLGLVCYPSCFWLKDSECTFPGKKDKYDEQKH
ncbi:unnamed protein product [marine sediment metagenome]|uniref:Uncharacterized protein n=1 Tax=marine sediment metagenome TaxID=412755 RepID=X1LPE0_9ZZZZ